MARAHFSLKSAHLLMWSSPLLLLVLVFTLSSASGPRDPAASSPPPSSTLPVTTQVPKSTTLPTTPTTARMATPPVLAVKVTVTTQSVDERFSNTTTPIEKPLAPVLHASAMSGEFSGTLSPGLEIVDVPLQGPASWTLSTSGSTNQSLNCGAVTSPVTNQVVVGATQSCQLEITSTSAEASLTWQLTPVT